MSSVGHLASYFCQATFKTLIQKCCSSFIPSPTTQCAEVKQLYGLLVKLFALNENWCVLHRPKLSNNLHTRSRSAIFLCKLCEKSFSLPQCLFFLKAFVTPLCPQVFFMIIFLLERVQSFGNYLWGTMFSWLLLNLTVSCGMMKACTLLWLSLWENIYRTANLINKW